MEVYRLIEESVLSDPQERSYLELRVMGDFVVESDDALELFTGNISDSEMPKLIEDILKRDNVRGKIIHIRGRRFCNLAQSRHLIMYPDSQEGIYKAVVGIKGNRFKLAIPYLSASCQEIRFINPKKENTAGKEYIRVEDSLFLRKDDKTYLLGTLFMGEKPPRLRECFLDPSSMLRSKVACMFVNHKIVALFPRVNKAMDETKVTKDDDKHEYVELTTYFKTKEETIFRTEEEKTRKVESMLPEFVVNFLDSLGTFCQKYASFLLDDKDDEKVGVRFLLATMGFVGLSSIFLSLFFHSIIISFIYFGIGFYFQCATMLYLINMIS